MRATATTFCVGKIFSSEAGFQTCKSWNRVVLWRQRKFWNGIPDLEYRGISNPGRSILLFPIYITEYVGFDSQQAHFCFLFFFFSGIDSGQ